MTQHQLDSAYHVLAEYADWLRENEPYAINTINILDEAQIALPATPPPPCK